MDEFSMKIEQLDRFIESMSDTKGKLMPILQEAQNIFGALTPQVQEMISKKANIPLAEIYGVVTFYSQFRMQPKGKHTVSVCLGTACYVKGSSKVLEEAGKILGVEVGNTTYDKQFTLEATRCVGACGLAPIMTIGEDVFAKVKPEDIEEILRRYR